MILVALLARELGGSTRAQVLAALATALAPLLLTTGHFLGTVTVEITVGAGLALVLVRLVNGGDPRLWVLAGALVGLGLLNKWTFAFGVAGLALGLLVGNRDVLATPWLLAGAAVALALLGPEPVVAVAARMAAARVRGLAPRLRPDAARDPGAAVPARRRRDPRGARASGGSRRTARAGRTGSSSSPSSSRSSRRS